MNIKKLKKLFDNDDYISSIEYILYYMISNTNIHKLHYCSWYDDWYQWIILHMRDYVEFKSGYIYQCYYDREVGFYKVGKTKQLPESRMKQLNCESIIGTIYLENYWKVFDCSLYESLIHNQLKKNNIEQIKEHFKCDNSTLQEYINTTIKNYNLKILFLIRDSSVLQEFYNSSS